MPKPPMELLLPDVTATEAMGAGLARAFVAVPVPRMLKPVPELVP